MEKTGSRVAVALFCGLAICCAVMYITADGAESIYAAEPAKSVSSEDVIKTGPIWTNTPDGRETLLKYFTSVEAEIAQEEAERKKDVAKVEAQMARNFAFNAEARKKLKAAMLSKMAVNAKKAQHDLAKSMKFVQAKFAAAAALQNKRNNANIKRSAQLRATIAKNKAHAEKELAHAVDVQQRAMAALASTVNEHIAQTNKHVAINAAQIKANAKKAKAALDKQVAIFDKKTANAREEAAKGRSELAAQLDSQDKAIRQWANNKLKHVMAQTSNNFRRVREEMADDRQHADQELVDATKRMQTALDGQTAINDARYQQTISDIEATKKELDEKIAHAKTDFKISLMKLRSTVNDQVSKTNKRIDDVTNTVQKNKLAQAKINANVFAEQKRMIKLGNERQSKHEAKDKELAKLIGANKQATDARIKAMTAHFTMELNEVRATMKKNRAHASHMLAKKTAALYAEIAKTEREQAATNEQLAEQTRRAKLDIADALHEAKTDFTERLGALHKTVVDNDKKFENKIEKLTGVVHANAITNAHGRKNLKDIMDTNKAELQAAVRDAIHKGEVRMKAAQQHLTDLNDKTKASLNAKITTEISNLAKRAGSQIEGLRLQSKEARDEMRKELLYAIRSMGEEANKNIADTKVWAEGVFAEVEEQQANIKAEAASDREAIAEKIEHEKEAAETAIADATATMQRTNLALRTAVMDKIKKTNTKVSAYADQLAEQIKDADAAMKAQLKTLKGDIKTMRKANNRKVKRAHNLSVEQWDAVDKKIADSFEEAAKTSQDRFEKMYADMATQRKEIDEKLASSVNDINDSIAKQAALADERFSKTVKDIKAAQSEAAKQVKEAREDFSTELAAITSRVTEMETRLSGEVQVVAGELIDHLAEQRKVNRKTLEEIERIEKLMNHQSTTSKVARGKLRLIMDENKRAAHEEVVALDQLFQTKLGQIRKQADDDATAAANDLTKATEEMYGALEQHQMDMIAANEDSQGKITTYEAQSSENIKKAKEDFEDRLTTLATTISANRGKVMDGMAKLTGLQEAEASKSERDRALIREQHDALQADMNRKIVNAIQDGEAKIKAVAQRSRERLSGAQKALLVEITNTVEGFADKTFKTIEGKFSTIADNYLSLKAYAVSAEDLVIDAVGKGKGLALSSIGDLLQSVAALSDVDVEKKNGLAAEPVAPALFSSGNVDMKNQVTKINGLVDEFTKTANDVRQRWPMGLGHYLLMKAEHSMSKKGMLQVDKVKGKHGNFVFVNAHAVGLSHKMDEFSELAVRMATYEDALAKLTSALSSKPSPLPAPKPYSVPAPEYDGK